MGHKFVCIAVSITLLVSLARGTASSREPDLLKVRLIVDTGCSGCCGMWPVSWRGEPMAYCGVHVRAGAWEDSTQSDSAGVAIFKHVPIGKAIVWCDTTWIDHRCEESVWAGREVAIRRGTMLDSLRVHRRTYAGLFR